MTIQQVVRARILKAKRQANIKAGKQGIIPKAFYIKKSRFKDLPYG